MTSLNPVHTVGAHIEKAFRLNRGLSGRTAAKEALERMRIPDAAQRLRYYPHQLSGGLRQRVMIAMVIASNPRLLIADEPTTALHVTMQAQIMALLADRRAETGMSIFITDDIGLVAGIADQIMVMQNGVAVEQGPLDAVLDKSEFGLAYRFISHDMAVVERIARRIAVKYEGQLVEIAASVLSDPQHSYTKRLIAAVPAIERRKQIFAVDVTQVPSLVRPKGYAPPPSQWREAGPDHRVRLETI